MNDQYGDPRNYDPNVYGYDPNNDPNVWGDAPGWPENDPTAPPAAAPAPTPTAPTTPTATTGGKTPEQIEAEGREYDQQHGLVGGYMLNGVWVNGSPSSTGGGGGQTGFDTDAGAGAFDSSGFQWPQFNAPTYTPGPAFVAPKPFEFDAFKAPEFNDIYKDGSFIGRRDEGMNAIEHGAAAKGLTRLPQTLKALAGWNQDFASREYGNIFDRSAQTYGINRNNAADAYSTNYGISRDVWDRNENQNLNAFDRNYKSAYDSFDLNAFQPAKLTFDDMYRRWKAELDANTSLATGVD